MTAAEGTLLGIAKQTAYETPNVTDADFKYLLFTEGGVGPQNITIPLPPEVGGGALPRSMVKVGVSSAGALRFIPRPETLGFFLYGVTGAVQSVVGDGTTLPVDFYTHTMKLPTDQFAAPYYTVRNAPGNLWGEQYQDMRVSLLSLEWAGANFLQGSVAFAGGLPGKVTTAAWNAAAAVDAGPQFITPVATIELPTGSPANVLNGSFVAAAAIPMNEQYVVGRYTPLGLDIVSRNYMLTMAVRIDDATLYGKMMYDPAGGNAWAASIFKEANITLDFKSEEANYDLSIAANGQTGADANVFWSAAPIGIRAGRQLVMQVTGLIAASPTVDDPIAITLVNKRTSY